MRESLYFSQRSGRNPNSGKIDLELLKDLFLSVYSFYFDKDYFEENFGSFSHDNFHNFYSGKLGDDADINRRLFLILRKRNLWPPAQKAKYYTEDDLFDIIEFCYDHISIPIYQDEEDPFNFNGPGDVLDHYDPTTAQEEFRIDINEHLRDYETGYELDNKGCIVLLVGHGLEPIFKAQVPTDEQEKVSTPVENAIRKFRNRNSTVSDRRDAIRNLVDVLEYLRPTAKAVIHKQDERDLFNIANNFGIRHHNPKQKTDYDERIWLSWMFYYYLASIHAILRIIKTRNNQED